MRFSLAIAALLCAAASAETASGQPACAAPVGCAQPLGEPGCHVPCQPPTGAPPPTGQPPLGFFQAPPPTGAVQGPTEASGLTGLEITFPEMRLRLPSIQWPCHFRARTPARMMTESAVAPYVEGQALPLGLAAQPNWPTGMPPTGQPPQQGAPPCGAPVPSQGMPCTAPAPRQAAPPACDSKTSYRLDALELERRELELRLAHLQQALNQVQQPLPMNPLPASPAPPRTEGVYYAPPVYGTAPPVYGTQPASYAEPARMPIAPQPIREPEPRARITGVRAR